MSKYTKYKLYQKYETREGQSPIPCYPNVFSIDGDGTQTPYIVEENSRDCGYSGDTQPIYRWYPMPISSYYYCEECPTQYRWTNMDITTYYECVGTSKYYKQKKQYSYDGTNWYDFVPEETQRGELYQTNSPDCGYVEPQYRTTSGTPYCNGYDKYVEVYSQVSYNGGSTWTTTATTTSLVEHNSSDCGYVPPTPSAKYLTFVATQSGTFKFSGTSGNDSIQYSLDNGNTWNTLASGVDSPTVQSGNKIMWKGELIPRLGGSRYGIGSFSSTNGFTVEGNPMSLLYGDNFVGQTSLSGKDWAFCGLFEECTSLTSAENLSLLATTLAESCYFGMFSYCTSLTTVPQLPATTLTEYCYENMFRGCASLTTPPQLLATTLASNCYYGMFEDCTSLTTAPELLATTLANYCYGRMFFGCTSLTTAPSMLPATTLAEYCYNQMFINCTSLTTVPSTLPATTLANNCYQCMFQGCTSLTTAPQLPATTLASFCYDRMFEGCTSLNYIKCLATNISAYYCTDSWVSGVSSSGTFVKNSSMSGWSRGTSGIPSNWTVQNA